MVGNLSDFYSISVPLSVCDFFPLPFFSSFSLSLSHLLTLDERFSAFFSVKQKHPIASAATLCVPNVSLSLDRSRTSNGISIHTSTLSNFNVCEPKKFPATIECMHTQSPLHGHRIPSVYLYSTTHVCAYASRSHNQTMSQFVSVCGIGGFDFLCMLVRACDCV